MTANRGFVLIYVSIFINFMDIFSQISLNRQKMRASFSLLPWFHQKTIKTFCWKEKHKFYDKIEQKNIRWNTFLLWGYFSFSLRIKKMKIIFFYLWVMLPWMENHKILQRRKKNLSHKYSVDSIWKFRFMNHFCQKSTFAILCTVKSENDFPCE